MDTNREVTTVYVIDLDPDECFATKWYKSWFPKLRVVQIHVHDNGFEFYGKRWRFVPLSGRGLSFENPELTGLVAPAAIIIEIEECIRRLADTYLFRHIAVESWPDPD